MVGQNNFEIEVTQVPVKPVGSKEIRELEITLILGTILRPDVIQEILHPREFTTWVDSLTVAAGALAREKAGYPVSKIADELGRSENTIRSHLQGKTKAGQLVRETYELLKRGRLRISLPIAANAELQKRLENLEREVEGLKSKLDMVKSTLSDLLAKL